MSQEDRSQLAAALGEHAIVLDCDQIAQLDAYCRLLWDWNTKLNLTRHTDYARFVERDVVDSLELAKVLAADERVLDVGTGGGVPGVLLAILRPDLRVMLSESVGKKARAVEAIVEAMPLAVSVHAGRAEELLQEEYFDSLVVRAVAPLEKLLRWFADHWGAFGRLLVIKGPAWVEERREAREAGRMKGLQLRKLSTWPLPGTHSESVLLEIRPAAETTDEHG
ncbi:MAG TPA: 16S rRNA (guanine(527)-N(7))-methyltransferase RsmG [Pirellulales bacterium]|jgi:16S rRNA (guanine527-N7)-methyltransferase|nr:16S rRNA (guanine(527)-N(7))-methyltransferase RsmG [Pirellulales bacterium]